MMKRLIALILVFSLVALCGCTSGDESGPVQEAEPVTDEAEDAGEEEAETEESGEYDYTFALIVMDLSNPFFATMVEAAEAYADANNIELLVTDGANDSSVQIAAMSHPVMTPRMRWEGSPVSVTNTMPMRPPGFFARSNSSMMSPARVFFPTKGNCSAVWRSTGR